MKRALLACSALGLAGCLGTTEPLVRMSHGVPYEGRFIEPEAYAAYARGAELEAQGELDGALLAYRRAQALDPESADVWARIGSVQCRSAPAASGPDRARVAFEKALALEQDSPSTYYERALCAERAHGFANALDDARRAVDLAPADADSNLLVARLLVDLGRSAEARAWLEALNAFRPDMPAIGRALEQLRHGSEAPDPIAERLRAGDDAGAVLAAERATVRPSTLALMAARQGRAKLARLQAELELAADPTNADAWVAALSACDLLHDEPCFDRALEALRLPALEPSPLAQTLLDEVLARRVGTAKE